MATIERIVARSGPWRWNGRSAMPGASTRILLAVDNHSMIPIETERLVLRNFTPQDADSLFDYLHRPTAGCFLSLALADPEAAADEAKRRADGEEYVAVCQKASGVLVGDLFAMREEDTFSIGWNFNPRSAGRGFATEAAVAMVDRLFTQGNARRLYAYVETSNAPSMRICEKLGMRKEGVFKEFISFRNDADGLPVYEDTMQYAMLRREWKAPGRADGERPARWN
jgi:RimJ/RimL family protein N-acetyltransferase